MPPSKHFCEEEKGAKRRKRRLSHEKFTHHHVGEIIVGESGVGGSLESRVQGVHDRVKGQADKVTERLQVLLLDAERAAFGRHAVHWRRVRLQIFPDEARPQQLVHIEVIRLQQMAKGIVTLNTVTLLILLLS